MDNRKEATRLPTGLTPEPTTPTEKRKKVRAGRLMVILLGGVAALAFVLYLLIILFGSTTTGQ